MFPLPQHASVHGATGPSLLLYSLNILSAAAYADWEMFGQHGNTFPEWSKCLVAYLLSKALVSLWLFGTPSCNCRAGSVSPLRNPWFKMSCCECRRAHQHQTMLPSVSHKVCKIYVLSYIVLSEFSRVYLGQVIKHALFSWCRKLSITIPFIRVVDNTIIASSIIHDHFFFFFLLSLDILLVKLLDVREFKASKVYLGCLFHRTNKSNFE